MDVDYVLELVVVPVSDVDRAKRFYADQMGFIVDVDHQPSEDFRVVQMTPPGSSCSMAIGKGIAQMEPGTLNGLQISVADIEAAHAELIARGVLVSSIQHHDGSGFVDGKGGDYNSFVFFNDPDGNGWAIQESARLRKAINEAETNEAGTTT
jgi:catechol 2,3-dioxygenase-like lactoylglutathione lyase family enzyme